jgi:hypothetical protein
MVEHQGTVRAPLRCSPFSTNHSASRRYFLFFRGRRESMQKQKDLFKDDVKKDESPLREFTFDKDFLPTVEALFRKETSDPRTRSTDSCPFRIGETFFMKSPELMCECPASHALVKALGNNIPRCSENRCPVRIVLFAPVN